MASAPLIGLAAAARFLGIDYMGAYDDLLSGVYSPTVTEAAVVVREVRVRIGVLSRRVTIRIYYDPKREESYFFELSEFIKTQSEHDLPGEQLRSGPTEAETLRRAVRMLTEGYESAVRNGELPEDSWLVKADRK